MAESVILGAAPYLLNPNMQVALPVRIIIYFAAIYSLRVFDNDNQCYKEDFRQINELNSI